MWDVLSLAAVVVMASASGAALAHWLSLRTGGAQPWHHLARGAATLTVAAALIAGFSAVDRRLSWLRVLHEIAENTAVWDVRVANTDPIVVDICTDERGSARPRC